MTDPERNSPCPCGSGKKYKRCCYLKQHLDREREVAERQAAAQHEDELLATGDPGARARYSTRMRERVVLMGVLGIAAGGIGRGGR
jgi:hypothetical protein